MKKKLTSLSLSLLLSLSFSLCFATDAKCASSEDEDSFELTQTTDEAAPIVAPSSIEASEESVIPADESTEVSEGGVDLSVENSESY